MSISSPPRGAILALTLAAASWGIGTVVSKRAVDEIPPLTLLPIQLGASLIVLALLMRLRRLPLRDPSMPRGLGQLGLLNPGIAYALSLLGLATISASLSVLLWAMEPVLILFLAAWFLHERIGARFVVLSLVAIGGMLLVIYAPGNAGSLVGVALTVAGVASCAIYTVAARRWMADAPSTAQVVVAQQAYALVLAIGLVALSAITGSAVWPNEVSLLGWASAIGSGVLYYGMAYWFYLSGLRQVPASVAASAFYLIPVFGVAGGFVLLGERLGPLQWAGVAIASVAVLAILRRPPGSVDRTA